VELAKPTHAWAQLGEAQTVQVNIYLHDWIFTHLNFKLKGRIFKIQLCCSLSLKIYVHGFVSLIFCDMFN
jgi:hypothetical protein